MIVTEDLKVLDIIEARDQGREDAEAGLPPEPPWWLRPGSDCLEAYHKGYTQAIERIIVHE